MPSPITRSPLKVSVTEFGTHMSATDPDGNVVVDGARTTSRDPSVPRQPELRVGVAPA